MPALARVARHTPVPGSRYVREFCAECGCWMRISPDRRMDRVRECDRCKRLGRD